MGPTQNAILDVLRAHPQGLAIAALVAAAGLPEGSGKKTLERLAAAGAVQIGQSACVSQRTVPRAPRRTDYFGLLVRLP